ncbi:hypothetical protein EG68_12511 [Paragonimus skrjabini miyazakii]|uniref:Uncharacterized protein n=1 Tax=Paragonimus skrjabini miyazakii TaxID=59628 RepID=A0A8S9YPA2_9TREM|nr:hypothetical protein EG68_12511 [Paragonimus skrjabini miyazakii]
MKRMMTGITRLSNKHKPYLPLPVTSVMQLQEFDRKMLDTKFHSAMADYFRGISAPLKAFLIGQVHEKTEYATTPDSTLNECFKGWLHCARDKRSTQHASASHIEDENIWIVDLDEHNVLDNDAN